MSYRYGTFGYRYILPVTRLAEDSQQNPIPLFWLFDTTDAAAEDAAESYLAELTDDDLSLLMYESKTTLRAEFEGFQNMFLLLGGLLCAIIGLVGKLTRNQSIHKKPPLCGMLDHPKIFECFSDCFLFFRWTLGLSGILGFRQIIVFAYFNPTFPFDLRDIEVGHL